MDLQECRRELDEIDEQIVRLFERRMKVCSDVADDKIATGRDVYDAQREQQKLEAVSNMTHSEYNRAAAREIFTQIMAISRRFQYAKMARNGRPEDMGFQMVEKLPKRCGRIAYQGVEGAYSHEAALQFFGKEADVYHVPAFEDAMREVQEKNADYAVLPIENSSAGAVNDNFDLLAEYHNYMVGEVFLPVNHALLGCMDTKLSDIDTVYSHPQALAQCSHYLNERNWHQVSFANTAVAAQKVLKDQNKAQAAIASEAAGELYGLKVLDTSIQNNRNNTTRFMVISDQPMYRRDAHKISISFELPHRCGTLYNILGNFVFNHVNLFMIQSRPIQGRNWEYRFFVDIEGNLQDAAVQNAFKSIAQEASNVKILGNY